MSDVKIVIELTGNLPKKYLRQKRRIIERIKGDAEKIFGEYEIWGEFFGNDENVYSFFLKNVRIEGDND